MTKALPTKEEYLSRFHTVTPIQAGWSEDEKYQVTTPQGQRFFLRIYDHHKIPAKEQEFEFIEAVAQAGVPVAQGIQPPDAFAPSPDQSPQGYMLCQWVDGQSLEAILPTLPPATQHQLGITFGQNLKKIHQLSALDKTSDNSAELEGKLAHIAHQVSHSQLSLPHIDHMLITFHNTLPHIKNRPQCRLHGDYTLANALWAADTIHLIDFDSWTLGDPFMEFKDLEISQTNIPSFYAGRLEGYFAAPPPADFEPIHQLYNGVHTLTVLLWLETVLADKQAQDFQKNMAAKGINLAADMAQLMERYQNLAKLMA